MPSYHRCKWCGVHMISPKATAWAGQRNLLRCVQPQGCCHTSTLAPSCQAYSQCGKGKLDSSGSGFSYWPDPTYFRFLLDTTASVR
jgi:hypothetical protein